MITKEPFANIQKMLKYCYSKTDTLNALQEAHPDAPIVYTIKDGGKQNENSMYLIRSVGYTDIYLGNCEWFYPWNVPKERQAKLHLKKCIVVVLARVNAYAGDMGYNTVIDSCDIYRKETK